TWLSDGIIMTPGQHDMAESNPERVEWPAQVDIPEHDEWEETPEQTEKDEQENTHILVVMAKEIKEIITQELAKAHAAALSHLKEYFANRLCDRAKEWWNYTLDVKGLNVTRNLSWNEFKELFLQKFASRAELKNIRRDF
ncbi:hypothetical protein Tco_1077888, partial [Tanacetum coccineum]